MIVPDKDKRIIRFIFSEANFCLGSNPFPEKKDEKIFFSSGMMMVRSIVRGDCPCILQLFSSETIASWVSSPYYFPAQGRRYDALGNEDKVERNLFLLSFLSSFFLSS